MSLLSINMPRLSLITAVMAVLVGPAWTADEAPETKLPEAVQGMIDRATSDISKERQKYDAAAKKLTDKLVADLKKEVEKATKAGNLKMALAIQAQIDDASKGVVVTKAEATEGIAGDLLGESGIAKVKFDQSVVTDTLRENVVFFQNRGYTASGIGEQLLGLTFTKNAGNGAKDIPIQVLKAGTIYLGVSQDGVDDQLIKTIEKAGWKRQKELDFTVGKGPLVLFSRSINQKMTIPNYGGFSGSVVMAKTAE